MSNPMPVIAAKESPWLDLPDARAASVAGGTAAASAAPAAPLHEGTGDDVDAGQIEQAVKQINTELQTRSISLQFEVDAETDKVVVKVVDQANGVVIRQIPTEEVVRIAKVMGKAPGLLVNGQA